MNKSRELNLSVFTVTFAVEVVGLDVWHDCNEGRVELGHPDRGVQLSYQLYPGKTFEANVVIWPHVAKVSSGGNYGWVRTWQFLERRWLSFSIRHAFPMKVLELRDFVATITVHSGLGAIPANAKSVFEPEVYLLPVRFGERRQFASVNEGTVPLLHYIEAMLWSLVVHLIPVDEDPVNVPLLVKDIRHQDAILCQIRDVVLSPRVVDKEEQHIQEVHQTKKSTIKPVKETKPVVEKTRHAIQLSGDWILAGNGRVTPFVISGHCPVELGEVLAVISSTNLPANGDFPTFFVNVCNISDVPVHHLKQNGLTHIYTSWTIVEENRSSGQQSLEKKKPISNVNINDHHSVPLSCAVASDVMASFLDKPFCIELRGIRQAPQSQKKNTLFGYDKGDREGDRGKCVPPPIPNQDVDFLIAHTRIDARALTKNNGLVKGEFPLFPPQTSVVSLDRAEHCTNDMNAIRAKIKPDLFIQAGVILEAQMLIEVSMGLVGCIHKSTAVRYSRLCCLISDRDAIMALLCQITEINKLVMQTENEAVLLTGFALDTGDTVILYVEGPKEGHILQVWERTEDFYPTVKPVFSTSAKYSSRLYHDFLLSKTPFNIMKMFAPLSLLLSLTPVYVRPALPLPARSALLKIGRLKAGKLKSAPSCLEMPTASELTSFRLELCVAPRPVYVSEMLRKTSVGAWSQREPSEQNETRFINWKREEQK